MDTTDAILLRRWHERRDADAFAELVVRYSGLVYGACRRVLRNATDAEDVAQDCFVELMRGRPRVNATLAPWLYTVAVRRSLDRRKADMRRRKRDATGVQRDARPATCDIHEIWNQVDEAIASLPAALKDPLVMRFLDGDTHQSIGRTLNISESTVRFRIQKALTSIRATLERRGIALTVAALTAALTDLPAEAAPAALRESLARTSLVESMHAGAAASTMAVTAMKAVAAVVVAVVLALAGISWLYHSPSPDPERSVAAVSEGTGPEERIEAAGPVAEVPLIEAEAAETLAPIQAATESGEEETSADPFFTLTGSVVDEGGFPVFGAEITAITWDSATYDSMHTWVGTSDGDGFYAIEGITGWNEGKMPSFIDLSVSAEGYRAEGKRIETSETTVSTADFMLEKGEALAGRLVTPTGAPIEGAIIKFLGENYTYAITKRDGTFAIGPYRYRAQDAIALLASVPDVGKILFDGLVCADNTLPDLVLKEFGTISGRITWSDGRPGADVTVSAMARYARRGGAPDYAAQVMSWNGLEIEMAFSDFTTADADGRYEFKRLSPAPDYLITVSRDEGSDSGTLTKLAQRSAGPLGAGEHRSYDVTLEATTDVMVVSGRIVGKPSGRELPHMSVNCIHSATQEPVAVTVPYGEATYTARIPRPGRYRIWPHSYALMGDEPEMYGRDIIFKAGETFELDLEVPDPYTASVRVVASDGSPISGAELSLGNGGTIHGERETDEEGFFSWDGFIPGRAAWFQIEKEGYLSTTSTRLIGDVGAEYPTETVLLYPEAGVEGRLVMVDGTALSATGVGLDFAADGVVIRREGEIVESIGASANIDPDGYFAVAIGLPAVAGKVTARVYGPDGIGLQSEGIAVTLQAGYVTDLGAVRIAPVADRDGDQR